MRRVSNLMVWLAPAALVAAVAWLGFRLSRDESASERPAPPTQAETAGHPANCPVCRRQDLARLPQTPARSELIRRLTEEYLESRRRGDPPIPGHESYLGKMPGK
jgi:cytochrome c-type biogenesis protein CcmH/NrfF